MKNSNISISAITFGWLIAALCALPCRGMAQNENTRVEYREIPGQKWEKASGGLDYSKDRPKAEEPEKENPFSGDHTPAINWGAQLQELGNILQVLAILAAAVAIGYGIYRMVREPRNRRIARDGAEITLDNLDAYIHETDLERFLREALDQNNYALAIRLYFLQIIKDLSQNGSIHWSKEKTNRDYLREMRSHPLAVPFQQTILTFERVWYGNMNLTRSEFDRLAPAFKQLLGQLA